MRQRGVRTGRHTRRACWCARSRRLDGIEIMRSRRPSARKLEDLASGPGKAIDSRTWPSLYQYNGVDVTRGSLVVREPAGEAALGYPGDSPNRHHRQCADRPLRFLIAGNPLGQQISHGLGNFNRGA